jgi:hypothetical protein
MRQVGAAYVDVFGTVAPFKYAQVAPYWLLGRACLNI